MTVARLKKQIDVLDDAPEQAENISVDGPEPGLIETPTSKQIYQACAHAQETPALVLIYGAAGVSKTTTALRYVQDKRPTAAYHVNLLGVATPTSMLVVIAECVYPSALADSYRKVALMRSLVYHLRPGDLLILDECQSLRPEALDLVRVFLDEAGVGLVLMGNEMVFSTIAGKHRHAMFAQLHSRVGMKLHLPHPTEADADAVLKSFGVCDGAGHEYGRQLALGPLALRGLVTILRQARIVAIEKKRALDHQLMYAVASALGLND